MLSTALVAVTVLARFASEAQKTALLPGIARGERIVSLAVDEGAKHKPEGIALSAKRAGNGFRLDGGKGFVLDGAAADTLIVAARTAGAPGETAGITLFLVDAKAKGVTAEQTIMVDNRNAARFTFEGVEVDGGAVIGEVDGGWAALEAGLNAGRAGAAAELVGAGGEVFERTVAYVRERKQFGKLIGEFQGLQHRLAHLYTEMEIARATSLKALQMLDEKPDAAGPYVALAKAKTGEIARLASQEGVQMHGGMGMTDDLDFGIFMKKIRVTQEIFGDANFHTDRIARLRGY